jgi:hypothetical protein
MAIRPVFIPINKPPFVEVTNLEFEWFPGFAISQAQKSIKSLHSSAKKSGIIPILEISTKSNSIDGRSLSAFNLNLTLQGNKKTTLECVFQGSKVFENGGPFSNLYSVSSIEAKRDRRLQNSGKLIEFNLLGDIFPINPQTVFYDWLYINALSENKVIAEKLLDYSGFSDIAFNPKKSINCQARSAALFVALSNLGKLQEVLESKNKFLSLMNSEKKGKNDQQLEMGFI